MSLRLPDLVVVGAQKAGTTGVLRSLGAASGVFVPQQPEATFLHGAGTWEQWVTRHVRADLSGYRLVAIKLATLMYFADSVARLRELNPDVRVVVMLRHPVERLISLYGYLCQVGSERRSLLEALRDDELAPNPAVRMRTYSGGSRYAEALEFLFGAFAREQILVLTQDEAKRETGMAALQAFAGISAPVPVVQANGAASARWPFLSRAMQKPLLRTPARLLVPAPQRLRIRQTMRSLNRRPPSGGVQTALPLDFRAELLARHEVDVVAAEQFTGHDLPDWRR